jgi:predicted RNA-binding Zn ribbon-like protein
MAHAWTERQFVGGAVALDFANTVCYRGDPTRCFDKILDSAELSAFGAAALQWSDAAGARAELPEANAGSFTLCREIRETVDALFRPLVAGKGPEPGAFRMLLRMHEGLIAGLPMRLGKAGIEIDASAGPGFAAVLTQSAMRLAASPDLERLKICPNCRWLFIDRSRNASRVWCDMLTCGNRAKAQRFQRRQLAVDG